MLHLYQQFNGKRSKRLLFRLGSDAGFFSEYNNMVIVIYYCMCNDIQFLLYSKDANFSYKYGWTDYFEPFCEEYFYEGNNLFNLRYDRLCMRGKRIKLKYMLFQLYMLHNNIDYLTYDIFYKARGMDVDQVQKIPELGLEGSLVDNCRAINSMIWRYNKVTSLEISKRILDVKLPKTYVSVHIRRGDKKIEADYIDIKKYMVLVSEKTNCKNIFVATDDYSVYEEVCVKYPDWNFYTNTRPSSRGYDQRTFEKKDVEIKKDEILDLFTTIEIMAKSILFVGTLNSNIGMYMYWRMPQGKCLGVDYQKWRIW